MSDCYITYLRDHLAGAKFALSLLDDLREQTFDRDMASIAAALHPEIQADRDELERYVDGLGGSAGPLRQAAAWLTQKASKFKLSLEDPLGRFEAIEALTLGVQGKLALWNTMKELMVGHAAKKLQLESLDLDKLRLRALTQAESLECFRRNLARRTFVQETD